MLTSLLVIVVIAFAAPLLCALLPPRWRIPQVVVFIVGGIVAGPQVLGWANAQDVDLLKTMGMGFLFLLAGYELDLGLFRERAGKIAIRSWLVSLAAGLAIMGGLYALGVVDAPVVLAIALTTTALGTLIPIMKENGMLEGRFGRIAFAMGAVGELGPILAMALFLGTRGTLAAIIALMVFLAVVAFAMVFPTRLMPKAARTALLERSGSTSQTTLRLVIALLVLLLLASQSLGFDAVLGAFAAGMVLRRWTPGGAKVLEDKLEAVGYGFFIPIFFVCSGLTLDVRSIAHAPVPMLIFLAFLFAVRGLPALAWYRRDLSLPERWQMVLLSATALPLLVALAEVGVNAGTMSKASGAAIIGAGVVSVMVFPMAAVAIGRGAPSQVEQPALAGGGTEGES